MDKPPPFKPQALGEIAIRCSNPEKMAQFYERLIGLDRLSGDHNADIIFLKIADGFQGHTSVLALFHHSTSARNGLHPTSPAPPVSAFDPSLLD